MEPMGTIIWCIVYGFELFGLGLLLIGIFGFFAKDTDNELIQKLYKIFFVIEDDEGY